MGWIEKSEISKARTGALIWIQRWFRFNEFTLYDFQLFIMIVTQFIYSVAAPYCPHEGNKLKVNEDIINHLLPFHNRLCTHIIRCRNKLCHVNGSDVSDRLLNNLWKQSVDILDLMRFLGLLPSDSLESRLKILSGDKLAVYDPIQVIKETGWDDIVLLVSKLYGFDPNIYK